MDLQLLAREVPRGAKRLELGPDALHLRGKRLAVGGHDRLKPRGNEVVLTLIHRPIPPEFEKLTLLGWHTLLEMLGVLSCGATPEPRDTIMERNRVRYGVERLPSHAARG